MGKQKCLELLYWYAFIGCDIASRFNGHGNKTAWNVLGAFLEITDVLARLLLGSADIVDEDLTLIERFFVLLYDRTGSTASTNGARRLLFTNKGKSIGNCPPTLNALLQHIYRCILQSSSWRQA